MSAFKCVENTKQWEISYNLVNFCSLDVDSGTNIGMVLVCLGQREM